MLEKSEETLSSGRLEAANRKFNSAVNRYYYSCYQKVATLMLLKNISSSKHTHVRGFVNKDLAYVGLLPSELAKMYNKLLDLRQEADYSFEDSMTEDDLVMIEGYLDQFHEKLSKLIEIELKRLDRSNSF